jgi:ABC-2 type transport system ATP-binding protein
MTASPAPTASSETVIAVRGLRKVYGRTVAVEDVSFDVARGEIFGLLGSNGAGKTTTVECVEGLRRPDAGDVTVLGFDPRRQSAALRGRIGSQLQESRLPDHLKVWEALELFAGLAPRALDWRELLEAWGLSEKRSSSFSSLSGGQRQRLFVALALVSDPEIVVLDEMTTGLDPGARHVAWELVEEIRDRGTTVVLVTHFMDEAERLCDRLAVVERGRVVALGSPAALIDEYAPEQCVLFTTDAPDLGWLSGLDHVRSVTRRGPRVTVRGDGPVLARVAAALVGRGVTPRDLRVERPSLEQVFLRLTGHLVED